MWRWAVRRLPVLFHMLPALTDPAFLGSPRAQPCLSHRALRACPGAPPAPTGTEDLPRCCPAEAISTSLGYPFFSLESGVSLCSFRKRGSLSPATWWDSWGSHPPPAHQYLGLTDRNCPLGLDPWTG